MLVYNRKIKVQDETVNEYPSPSLLRAAWQEIPMAFVVPLSAPFWWQQQHNFGDVVLMLPGYLENDRYMRVLGRRIAEAEFDVHYLGYGINWGPDFGILEHCEKRIRQLSAEFGQKVHLVGHSAGGVYAHYLTHVSDVGSSVASLVTIGAPVGALRYRKSSALCAPFFATNSQHRILSDELTVRKTAPTFFGEMWADTTPPMTTFYSPKDAVVNEDTCILPDNSYNQTIAVFDTNPWLAGHYGMLLNPQVAHGVIASLYDHPAQELAA